MRHLALMIPLLLTAIAFGDVITLDDGSTVQGRIVKTVQGWRITRDDGSTLDVGTSRVRSIEVSGSSSRPGAAQEGLASLQRAVDHLDDASEAVTRYQRFITQNTDPDVLKQANEDLILWQQRRDEGLVKIADKWVTPQERDRLRQIGQAEALSARDLFLQRRSAEAEPILTQALIDDPQNATALYIQGVLFNSQNKSADARQAFAAANKIVPNYAPILNNLAVLFWQQRSFFPALGYYDQAMLAAPPAKEILDNVAEALNALTPDNRNTPAIQRVTDHFNQQDAILRQQQAKAGFFRWGAIWVSADQLKQLQADDDKVKQQVDDLRHEFDSLQQKIGAIDGEIDQNLREMHRLEAANSWVNQDGVTIQLLPQSYWDLQDDNKKLANDKNVLLQQQDELQREAVIVQQKGSESSIRKYTGSQQLLGVEAAPLRFPAGAPTNLPATQP